MRAIGVVVLLLLAQSVSAADKKEELTPERRQELEKKANELMEQGERYYELVEFVRAQESYREALAIRRALYPKKDFPQGHFDLLSSIAILAQSYQAMADYAHVEPLRREALEMARALFPKKDDPLGRMVIGASILHLAMVYLNTGEYGKAEPLYREGLAMVRARFPKEKYPNGHREIAAYTNQIATLYLRAGKYTKAEPLFRESLAMARAFYPKEHYPQGHPDLALSIGSLASVYQAAGDHSKAQPLCKEALAMNYALFPKDKYPHGHPFLAGSINNLAVIHMDAGEYAKAEPLFKEALEMFHELFPKEKYPLGHPSLALSINNLGALHQRAGKYGNAEPLLKEGLGMYQALTLGYADLGAETEALNYVVTQPLSRDLLLSASRHLPDSASVYDALWSGRAALTRLQERRHRDHMAIHDKETADLAEQLRLTRLSLSGLLLKPGRDLDAHRALVQKLTQDKEDLEKRIAAKLNLATPKSKASSPKASQLAEVLPDGAVFVDLYRYFDFEYDPEVKGKKGEKRTPRYVAFVLRKGKDVARIDLKEAAAIDDAWAAWHKTITVSRPDEAAERKAATALAKLVWEPLRAALPTNLKTVYLVPDGQLTRVPWGALPGRKPDTVLLDECAIGLVPHGPFLLEHLLDKPAERTGDTLLVYGGVAYDQAPGTLVTGDDVRAPLLGPKRVVWKDLPGTVREQEQVTALARAMLKDRPIVRSGAVASTAQLVADLPKARYAHLATHGFFADPQFRSALQVDPQLFDRLTLDRRGGARSPSVLSGLVLAGANREGDAAAADRGILTGDGLLGMHLEGLELAVLSACETGLGEEGGGEGVYGLQRSFHVAGCQSVIASLWKVDDGATQVLMVLFYRNLWEKRLDAAEALRQAQLTLYRHPEAVQTARKRGFDFSERDLPKNAVEPGKASKRSPTAQWAAFAFSGVRPVPTRPE